LRASRLPIPVPNLLFVVHAPSDNTRVLRDAVVRGIRHPDVTAVVLRVSAPVDAGPDDVRWADGMILGTTENFGSMAGLVKDFFERIYYPCLDHKQGLPYCLYVRAGTDGMGACVAIERIVTGLRWRAVQAPLLLPGEFCGDFPRQCELLGHTMALGLDAGIY
jgi:hypothetical protein